jgi:predicted Ser/Thr protein kinase
MMETFRLPSAGDLLKDRYRIDDEIGEGGMGVVYRAEDLHLNRLVAIKFVNPKTSSEPTSVDAANDEFAVLARLSHRNIVDIKDYGYTEQGTLFLVMEYVDGQSLEKHMNHGGVPSSRRRQFIAELCEAVDYLHRNNVIHLDLKPSNILIDPDKHVRLIDFGLAQHLIASHNIRPRGHTAAYASPEQLGESAEPIGPQSDIYSLGMLIWYLLSGCEIFSMPSQCLNPALEAILRKATARVVGERYATAKDLWRALSPHIDKPRNMDTGIPNQSNSERFTRGFPEQQREAIRHLLEQYTYVFGGRRSEIDELDRWLLGQSRLCVVHAPAGTGKTALLVNWALRLEQSGYANVLFYPINRRYQTADEYSVLYGLAKLLCTATADERQLDQLPPQQLRAVISNKIRTDSTDGKRLVVIVDGIDEAEGWSLKNLLPGQPGAEVSLLVSVRDIADMDVDRWLQILGWNGARTAELALQRLDRDGLAQMIRSINVESFWTLADDPVFMQRFETATEGDPLTARMMLDGLLSGEETPTTLARRSPGLRAYIREWIDEIFANVRTQEAEILLSLCAVALGPISEEDLATLYPDVLGTSFAIRRAIQPIQRFVMGDRHKGYAFVHPRLQELFSEELLAAERKRYCDLILDKGREYFSKLPLAQMPDYLFRYWMAHLAEQQCWDELHSYLTQVDLESNRLIWAEYTYAKTYSYRMYLDDLALLGTHTLADSSARDQIARQALYALIAQRLNALMSGAPVELLLHCQAFDLLSPDEILNRLMANKAAVFDQESLAALLGQMPSSLHSQVLAFLLSPTNTRRHVTVLRTFLCENPALAGIALQMALSLDDEEAKAPVLIEILRYIDDEKTDLMRAIEIALCQHEPSLDTVQLQAQLLSLVDREQQEAILDRLIETIDAFENPCAGEQAEALADVFHYIPIELQAKAMSALIRLLEEKSVSDQYSWIILPLLTKEKDLTQASVISLLNVCESNKAFDDRSKCIIELLPLLPEYTQDRVAMDLYEDASQLVPRTNGIGDDWFPDLDEELGLPYSPRIPEPPIHHLEELLDPGYLGFVSMSIRERIAMACLEETYLQNSLPKLLEHIHLFSDKCQEEILSIAGQRVDEPDLVSNSPFPFPYLRADERLNSLADIRNMIAEVANGERLDGLEEPIAHLPQSDVDRLCQELVDEKLPICLRQAASIHGAICLINTLISLASPLAARNVAIAWLKAASVQPIGHNEMTPLLSMLYPLASSSYQGQIRSLIDPAETVQSLMYWLRTRHLSKELVSDYVPLIDQIECPATKLSIYVDLLPYVDPVSPPNSIAVEIESAIANSTNVIERLQMRSRLIPLLGQRLQYQEIDALVADVEQVEGNQMLYIPAECFPYFSDEMTSRLLIPIIRAARMDSQEAVVQKVSELVCFFPNAFLQRLTAFIQGRCQEGSHFQIACLVAMIPHLPSEEMESCGVWMLEKASSMDSDTDDDALIKLDTFGMLLLVQNHLPPHEIPVLIQNALDLARRLQEKGYELVLYEEFIPYLMLSEVADWIRFNIAKDLTRDELEIVITTLAQLQRETLEHLWSTLLSDFAESGRSGLFNLLAVFLPLFARSDHEMIDGVIKQILFVANHYP